MIREIKTRLSLDGEREFKNAMADANREMRVMNADLKAMAAEFASTGDQQKYFTDRAEMMGSKVKQQELIVEALQKAVKDSAQAYGEAARQTDDYRIQLSNATAKLFDMRRASEDANRELEALGRDSNKIGRQIENGIGDAAEDAGEKLDSMFERVQKDVNALKSSVAVQVGLELGSKVFDALQGAVDFVEESREYRRLQSFAEQSAIRNNLDIAEVERYANEIAVFFGDYDAAVETVAVLTEAGFKGETLGMAVDNLIGAAIAYYNTLNTESLAESIQETIATGELTGQYAELVDRLQGITMITAEDLEKELKAAKTQEEKLELLMSPLTEAGMQSNKFDYEARNAELLKAARADAELQKAWSELAGRVEPTVAKLTNTAVTIVEGMTTAIDEIDKLKQNAQEQIETGTTGQELIQNAGISMDDLKPDFITRMVEWRKKFNEKLMIPVEKIENWLIPSAGAETLPAGTADPYEAGFQAMQQYNIGLQEAADAEVTAAQAAAATAIAQMQSEANVEAAMEAGKNAMIAFGNGIAEGAAIPINNVRDMVNTINQMLSQIATPAYGLGWSGITGGNIYLYNQQRNNARALSKMIGRGVQVEMVKN